MIGECDRPPVLVCVFCEDRTREGLRRDLDRVGSPGDRPFFDAAVVNRDCLGLRKQVEGLLDLETGRRGVPICMKVLSIVLDYVAANRVGGRIDPVCGVGIDLAAVIVQVNRSNMERLVKCANMNSASRLSAILNGGGDGPSSRTTIAAVMAATISWSLVP